jgi:hypothetical protein
MMTPTMMGEFENSHPYFATGFSCCHAAISCRMATKPAKNCRFQVPYRALLEKL